MAHPNEGQTTPSGYRVGDLISYVNNSGRTRFAVVVPPPDTRTGREMDRYPWGNWADTVEEA